MIAYHESERNGEEAMVDSFKVIADIRLQGPRKTYK
jgi:hypothetical protein